MVRRGGRLWGQVVSYRSLEEAALRAARGKRLRAGVARFLADREARLLALQRVLRTGRWRPSPSIQFEIHDPKLRLISAPPFPDRVVHHALISAVEPVLERRMVAQNFACRRGKGTLAALLRAQGLAKRFSWALKLDVARFFPSLEHQVVLETLERSIKDQRVLALCRTIVVDSGLERGLPIGSLTSQWFANLVLDRLDHFVAEGLRIGHFVRYMDDFLLFSCGKDELAKARERSGWFLREHLHLNLNPRATRLAPTSSGVPFLGWNVYPRTLRIRRRNWKRLRDRLRRRAWEGRRGLRTREEFIESARSVHTYLALGQTRGLRKQLYAGKHGRPPERAP